MRSISSNGSAAVQALLIAIIVLLVGFTGYYVWHAQKQSNKDLNQANNATKSATVKAKAPAAKTSMLTISEWGVQAPYDSSLTLEYTLGVDDAGVHYALFSSTQLDATGPACKEGGRSGGAVDRYKASDHYLAGDAEIDTGKTAAETAQEMGAGHYGHVGDYYYFYSSPQAACSDTSQDIQTKTMKAVQALLPKLEPIKQ